MIFSEQALAEAAEPLQEEPMDPYPVRNRVALLMPGKPPPADNTLEWREVMLPNAHWPFRDQKLDVEGVILVWRYGKRDELRMRAGVNAICYWPNGRMLTLGFWRVPQRKEVWGPIARGRRNSETAWIAVRVHRLSHEWESRLAQISAEQERMMKAEFPDAYEAK